MPIHQLFPVHKTNHWGEWPTRFGLINLYECEVLLFFGTKTVQSRAWFFWSRIQLVVFEPSVLSNSVGINRGRPIATFGSSNVCSECLDISIKTAAYNSSGEYRRNETRKKEDRKHNDERRIQYFQNCGSHIQSLR